MPFPIMPILKPVTEVVDNSFKMTVSMSAPSQNMTIPATGTNDFIINWGDGSAEEHITTTSPSHVYPDATTYQITITGTMTLFRFNNTGSIARIISIDQMGATGFTAIDDFVYGCTNLITIDTTGFDCSGIINMDSMCRSCTKLTTIDVSGWDVSSVTNMGNAFRSCSKLEVFDVSSWNTTSLVNLSNTFNGCNTLTTLDISGWDVSGVASIDSIFAGCRDIVTLNTDSWDTRNMTDVDAAFQGGTALTSSFDEYRWWNRTDDLTSGGTPDPIGFHNNTFKSSFNISNYASIPNDWKGL